MVPTPASFHAHPVHQDEGACAVATAAQRIEHVRRLGHEVQLIIDYILSTTDYNRTDRLWPAHFQVFSTNPLSVAYGAAGIALFLHEARAPIPGEVTGWLLRQPLSLDAYPPGLFVGLAGIAYAFLHLGLVQPAEQAMLAAYKSPLRFAEANLFVGAAGWGLASLHFHDATAKQVYLDRAIEAGEYIVRTAQTDGGGCYWPYHFDGRVNFGYGFGASGIALFLLHLGTRTGDERYIALGRRALEYEISNHVETTNGWSWGRYPGDRVSLPYWLYGSAGIGAVIIRYYELLRDARYLVVAEQIATSTLVKWAVTPGALEGLAGIGEFMLDMYYVTGQTGHLDAAHDIAETLLWFKIPREAGAAYPGRWLNRIANDFGTGSAGIGLFLDRLNRPRPRHFLDLVAIESMRRMGESAASE